MVLGKRQGGMVPGPLKSSGVLGGRSGKQCWDWILGSLVGEKLEVEVLCAGGDRSCRNCYPSMSFATFSFS